jgi:hypothetical protein
MSAILLIGLATLLGRRNGSLRFGLSATLVSRFLSPVRLAALLIGRHRSSRLVLSATLRL